MFGPIVISSSLIPMGLPRLLRACLLITSARLDNTGAIHFLIGSECGQTVFVGGSKGCGQLCGRLILRASIIFAGLLRAGKSQAETKLLSAVAGLRRLVTNSSTRYSVCLENYLSSRKTWA